MESEQSVIQLLCNRSATLRHYVRVANETDFTYGRYRVAWKDSVCTRLRIGYKYYWQVGVPASEAERRCRLCGEADSHTLPHYVLHCSALAHSRHGQALSLTDQVIYMFTNNTIAELLLKNKHARNLVSIMR